MNKREFLGVTALAAMQPSTTMGQTGAKSASVFNVVDFGAKGDGKTDDTEAIQQALLEHPHTNAIIYLPNGTYLVSGSLQWPGSEDDELAQRGHVA
ncbi:MAG: glycosyl hydrolase family 28-related protein [Deltaproteobacteria bacterium]